ncbi:MAG: hypothetical protein HYX92_01760 [Chloroflexi bacterium]|nr:hypothetical protein [Chloroflexota bacterium]
MSVVGAPFVRQAKAVAKALGAENLAIAEYPGLILLDDDEDLRKKVAEVVVQRVVEGLTTPVADAVKPDEPGPRDIVFQGTLAEVQEFFHQNLWTDGLPIIPPTIEEIEKFLRFTDRSPDEVLGVVLPENREATIWNIAVNGVMSGCRPEYMPILIAVVEAVADPQFRIEDGGSTPGWEPIIILNGPIVKDLNFNYESGVMRVGRQPNTSIGRFLRLYMRNVAGLRIPPGGTDKGSIAQTFNVVLAENEDAVAELGWQPFSVDRGFKAGDNVVTVQSVVSISPPTYSGGQNAIGHLETIAEVIGRRAMAPWTPIGASQGRFFPLFVMSPSVAGVIARGGFTKDDIRQYLYDNVKAEAGFMEKLAWQGGPTHFTFCRAVEQGLISEEYCQSTDPERLVRVFLRPDWISIVVSGDPGRNQSKGYVQNQKQGWPTSKKVVLPGNWNRLLAR